MTIAEITKKVRRRERLTQAGMAAALGVTKQAVSHWEKGVRKPERGFLFEIVLEKRGWERDWALDCLGLLVHPSFEVVEAPEG